MKEPIFFRRKNVPEELAKELYDIGYCDQQIADELDVSVDSVRGWRRRSGLEGHKAPYKKPKQNHRSTLVELAAEANAHGMTYGQYMVAKKEGKL